MKFIDIIKMYRGIEFELTIEVRKDNYFKYAITVTDYSQVPQELKDIELRQINDWFIKSEKYLVINLK